MHPSCPGLLHFSALMCINLRQRTTEYVARAALSQPIISDSQWWPKLGLHLHTSPFEAKSMETAHISKPFKTKLCHRRNVTRYHFFDYLNFFGFHHMVTLNPHFPWYQMASVWPWSFPRYKFLVSTHKWVLVSIFEVCFQNMTSINQNICQILDFLLFLSLFYFVSDVIQNSIDLRKIFKNT